MSEQTAPEQHERADKTDIAIVSVACRFPGDVGSPEAYWRLLRDGVDCVESIPRDRWDIDAYYDPNPDAPGKMVGRHGAFLRDIDKFDPSFFGISPGEARRMDPQQRLLLEVSWEALERAGRAPAKLAGSRTGVFVGLCSNDYGELQKAARIDADAYTLTGTSAGVAAGRISYALGLCGPAMSVDTAFSSSLVAIHLACESLWRGECDLALAGAANLILDPDVSVRLSKLRVLSREGRCRTFDEGADGYVRGEGCGVVVLKRLADATRDGDHIVAIVRGIGVNNDGRKVNLTTTSTEAQCVAMREALRKAGVTADEIGLVETHGSGSRVGDPIELAAIKTIYGAPRPDGGRCAVASVKTNFGHLEGAAGMAGFIKAALALSHGHVPAHLHFRQLNSKVSFDGTSLFIPRQLEPWPTKSSTRLAAVSAFGLSGTNVHIVLEAPREGRPASPAVVQDGAGVESDRSVHVLTFSGRTRSALQRQARRYQDGALVSSVLSDVCYSANIANCGFEYRLGVVAASPEAAVRELAKFRDDDPDSTVVVGCTRDFETAPRVAFLFTGQGSQYVGMASGLYRSQPTFRRAVDRCAAVFAPLLDRPLVDILFASGVNGTAIEEPVHAQPALFAIEYALYELWCSWGVRPAAVAGHSLGEYVAAHVAGVFSLEGAARLVMARARLMASLPPGELWAVAAEEQLVSAKVAKFPHEASIAAVNSPTDVVIGGTSRAIAAVVAALESEGIRARRIPVPIAGHSPLLEPILDEFTEIAKTIEYREPRLPIASNLSGRIAQAGEISNAIYWRRHMRETVQFVAGVRALHADGCNTFLEIGPHPNLIGMAVSCLPAGKWTWAHSLRRKREDWEEILSALLALYVRGVDVDWRAFDADYGRRRASVATYPFERQRYWFTDPDEVVGHADGAPAAESSERGGVSRVLRLAELAPRERRQQLVDRLHADLRRILSLPDTHEIQPEQPFGELGLASLAAIELKKSLGRFTGLTLSDVLVFTYPTVNALTEYLFQAIEEHARRKADEVVEPTRAALTKDSSGAKAKAKIETTGASAEAFAIIGMACRLPGAASSPDDYWRLLVNGVDAVQEIPASRWDVDRFYDQDPDAPGRMYVRRSAFIDPFDQFDAAFFGISPREASVMDPQQRLVLEVAWEALESAGIRATDLKARPVGVFLGINQHDYRTLQASSGIDAHTTTGEQSSVAAGRISYFFGLQGPSFVVDTACSSSLVAIHLACQSLRSGESELAITGGVNLILSPDSTIAQCKYRGLSPDGRCKTFDARADGYVRGEGGGLVVLKRLRDAQRDGDRILAVIRGSAVNQDGRSVGLTAPNGLAQQDVIRQALAQAALDGSDVTYVEAHGTGTSLGDPIEVEALQHVIGAPRADGSKCLLGAVKTNIGHLEAAAGVAGLIKVVLALQHEEIPGNLHFEHLNPRIRLEGSSLEIATERRAWPRGDRKRVAGVSSFGISGTNAHVIVEEAPPPSASPAEEERPYVLPLSGKTAGALRGQVERWLEYLKEAPARAKDIAYTAAVKRDHLDKRLFVVGETKEKWAEELRSWLASAETERAAPRSEGAGRVVFVFPGQGSQWVGMGRELVESEPSFREALEKCDRALRAAGVPWSLVERVQAGDPGLLEGIDVVQPTLFALEVSLAEMWRAWGVQPDAVVGHSMGEVAAACVAGVLTLEQGARVMVERSRLLRELSGRGAMAMAELTWAEAEQSLEEYGDRLSIAVSNGPRATVVAGEREAVERWVEQQTQRGVFCRLVKVDVASHSSQVDSIRGPLLEKLSGLRSTRGEVPMLSTVTGERVEGPELGPEYWVRNVREPVRFAEVIERLSASGHSIFIELSPHPILLGPVQDILAASERKGHAHASLRREKPERVTLLRTLGELYVAGYAVDWRRQYETPARCVALPGYAWQHERYWLPESATTRSAHLAVGVDGLGVHVEASSGVHYWQQELGRELDGQAYLHDHQVQGMPVVPAALYAHLTLSAAEQLWGTGEHRVEAMQWLEMLVLPEEGTRTVQVAVTLQSDGVGRVEIVSRPSTGGAWTQHARGTLQRGGDRQSRDAMGSLEEARARCGKPVEATAHYAKMNSIGLGYGPKFQTVEQLSSGAAEAVGMVRSAGARGRESIGRQTAQLDGCLQTAVGLVSETGGGPLLPVGIEELVLDRSWEGPIWCRTTLRKSEGRRSTFDLELFGSEGALIGRVKGLQLQRLEHGRESKKLEGWFYGVDWRAKARDERKQGRAERQGAWLLLADSGGVSERLKSQLESRDQRCVVVERSRERAVDYGSLLREAQQRAGTLRGVVHAWSLDARGDDRSEACESALHLVQAMVELGARDVPRLWFVTRGAQSIEGERVAVEQAPVWGFSKAVAYEHPELRCSCLDLDPRPEELEAVIASAVDELLLDGREDQVALRNSRRLVARLGRQALKTPDPRRIPAGGERFTLGNRRSKTLEGLTLEVGARSAVGPGQVQIEVRAAGLNLRDILKALGQYPGQDDSPVQLGDEFAGKVIAVGPGVDGVEIGDDVFGIAPESMASHVTADARFVYRKPAHLTDEQAATLPVVWGSAHYALHHVAHIQQGERILIQSAAGGVGLAAVQLARAAGAEIFATAGTPEKRAYLQSLGIAHVYDSRSLSFGDEVLRDTNGEGVDVVLNSLSGKFLTEGLRTLRQGGRFVELGKLDVDGNSYLPLEMLKRNISLGVVDPESIWRDRPAWWGNYMQRVFSDFEKAGFSPLPVTTFPLDAASAAFRYMADGHIGKVALLAPAPTAPIALPLVPVRPNGTYVVTGGLGGVGWAVTRWLAEQGATSLLLLGRSEPSEKARRAMRTLSESGVGVQYVRADVANHDELAAAFTRAASELPPIRGVIHAAAILDDGAIAQQTAARLRNVMAAKADGAWNLHRLTQEKELDFFVLFSSAMSILGSPGQSNYCAANAFLDALAHHRRALGLPATSINWGVWSDVGLAAADAQRGDRLAGRGIEGFTPAEGLEGLRISLEQNAPQSAFMHMRFQQWREFYLNAASSPFFSDLTEQESSGASSALEGWKKSLLGLAPDEALQQLEKHIQEQLAVVLRTDRTRLSPHDTLGSLGIDSLTAMELRNRLEVSLGLRLTVTIIWQYPSISKLASYVGGKLGISRTAETADVAEAPAAEASKGVRNLLAALRRRVGPEQSGSGGEP